MTPPKFLMQRQKLCKPAALPFNINLHEGTLFILQMSIYFSDARKRQQNRQFVKVVNRIMAENL